MINLKVQIEPIEKKIYKNLSLVVLGMSIVFLALRYFKVNRSGADFNTMVELSRIAINFGALILLSPLIIAGVKRALNLTKIRFIFILTLLIVCFFLYASASNFVNYLMTDSDQYDVLKNFRKLIINFGHIAFIVFMGTITIAYSALKKERTRFILLKDLKGTLNRVGMKDVIMIKSDDHYQKVYTNQGLFYIRDTIGQFQSRMAGDEFKRVHRSAIVNLNEIEKFTPNGNGEFYLKMSNGEEVKVSRSYKDDVKDFLASLK